MTEIRKNFLTGDCVLIAEDRKNRPMHFNSIAGNKKVDNKSECPFCIENESQLNKVIFKSENNFCRIIKNKYPAVSSEDGEHEVIIDVLGHCEKIHEYTNKEFLQVLLGVKQSVLKYSENANIQYISVFKNEGGFAGASIEHSHMQLMALKNTPRKISTISESFTKFYKENNKCYFCSLVEGKDIFTILENDSFRASTLYDDIYTYSITLIPKKHVSSIVELNNDELECLGDVLLQSIRKLNAIEKDLNYNLLFFMSPKVNGEINKDFHFFMQIIPRIGKFGGFELSSNNYISSVSPENACKALK